MSQRPSFSLDAPLDQSMLCLEASAGTGKTYTIEGLITRLIVEEGIGIHELLVVTFTRAATAELRTRIRKVLETTRVALESGGVSEGLVDTHHVVSVLFNTIPEAGRAEAVARIRRAIEGFDEAQISTLHGFCQRALQEHAFESGVPFEVDMLQSTDVLLQEIAQDWWSNSRHSGDPRLLNKLKADGLTVKLLTETAKAISKNPAAPLCPQKPDIDDVHRRLDRWSEAVEAFRSVWDDKSDEIIPALSEGIQKEYLHKRYFSVATLNTKIDAIDAWLRNVPIPDSKTAKLIGHFSSEYLAKNANAKGKKANYAPDHPLTFSADRLLAEHERMVEDGTLSDYSLHHMHEYSAFVLQELQRRKRQARQMSFEDLLRVLHGKVTGAARNPALIDALRKRYKVALIDEFQDTDPIQWGIFEAIFAHPGHRLVVVGDPKQAIYSFRGADIDTYIDARGHQGMSVQTLSTNHRSDVGVVKAVETLFTHDIASRSPFLTNEIEYPLVDAKHDGKRFWSDEATPPGIVFSFQRRAPLGGDLEKGIDPWRFPRMEQTVAAQIVAFLNHPSHEVLDLETKNRRRVRPSDIAVLVGQNKTAKSMQQALRSVGVPSTVRSDDSVFQATEAEELELVMTAVLDPSRSGNVRVSLVTALLGQDIAALSTLEQEAHKWNHWVERLRQWQERWEEKGFATFARSLTTTPLPVPDGSRQSIPERLLGWRDGERRVTNLFHLLEVIQEAVVTQQLTPKATLHWLQQQRALASDDGDEHRQLRLESDEDAVTITTIHRSKGLQYGFVWCPSLSLSASVSKSKQRPLRFRNAADGDQWWLDIGLDLKAASKVEHVQMALQTQREESLRRLYVALTRARHQVHVMVAATKQLAESPLGYLLFPHADESESAPEALELSSDDALFRQVQAVVDESGGTMGLVDLTEQLVPGTYSREQDNIQLASLQYSRGQIWEIWRRTSFSGLTRDAKSDHAPAKDYDALPEDGEEFEVGALPVVDTRTVRLAELPGGARTGNCMHKIYEDHDFLAPQDLEPLVNAQLKAFRFDVDTWSMPMVTAIQEQLQTPLCVAPELVLADLSQDQRFNELDFTFSLPTTGKVNAEQIAALMEAHGGPGLPRGYPQRLRGLKFNPLRGFMTGSIDLAFEHDGKWYVADYKSNTLGQRAGDYGKEGMAEAMSHHHYVLQYHIYAVAMHRYLQFRLGDTYSFKTHFGGVRYLFLRGMSPDYAPGTGVFIDEPPEALIEGLSQLFMEGGDV